MRLKPRIFLGILDGRESPTPWSHVANSVTAWLLGLSALLWILSYQYLRFGSSRDPTSYFFNATTGYERRYSLHREQQAYDFIRSANASSTASVQSQGDPFMCLGVATVARQSALQYVRGTIGSLLQGLSEQERQSIYLMPFIAHTRPSDHPIRQEPWLATLSDRVLEYELSGDDLARLQHLEEGHHHHNKSMYDYGYLLERCHQTGAAWTAIIEDDVLAIDGWYPRAQQALRDLSDKMANERWLYLRIFYTEHLLGWNSEEWPHYFGLVVRLLPGSALVTPRRTQ